MSTDLLHHGSSFLPSALLLGKFVPPSCVSLVAVTWRLQICLYSDGCQCSLLWWHLQSSVVLWLTIVANRSYLCFTLALCSVSLNKVIQPSFHLFINASINPSTDCQPFHVYLSVNPTIHLYIHNPSIHMPSPYSYPSLHHPPLPSLPSVLSAQPAGTNLTPTNLQSPSAYLPCDLSIIVIHATTGLTKQNCSVA